MNRVMPMSTRLWALLVLSVGMSLVWALAWPAPVTKAETPPPLPSGAGTQSLRYGAVAPNAADPAWARPLFFHDRAPRVAMLGEGGEAGVAAGVGFNATLTGIVRSPQLFMATLSSNGKPVRVRLGDEVEGQTGWRLVSLAPRNAVFRNGEQQHVLKLEARNIANAPPPPPSVPPAPANAPARATDGNMAPAAPVPDAASAPAASADERKQIEAIRQRIQARRQQAAPPPASAPSPKNPR